MGQLTHHVTLGQTPGLRLAIQRELLLIRTGEKPASWTAFRISSLSPTISWLQKKSPIFLLLTKKTALTIPVKVSYAAPPLSVLEALREAAREVPDVLASPEPQAYILSYDEFGISYLLEFWVTDFGRNQAIIGKVGRLIWNKFKTRNIEGPLPLSEKVKEVLRTAKEKERIQVVEEEREEIFRDLFNSSFLRYQEGEKAGEWLVSESEIREFASFEKFCFALEKRLTASWM